MKPLIQKLVELSGPSGYETDVSSFIRSEIESQVDEIYTDNLGSLIAKKGTRGSGGSRIMIAGHMDEIGIMVTHVDDKGFARFTNIGGVYPHTLVGSRVKFMNGSLGVIYLEEDAFSGKLPGLNKFFIDVGAKSKEECPVRAGDAAVFWRPFMDLGDRLVSKAMDDRIAVAIMIQALKTLESSPNELYFVFTAQEEVGVRGATASAYGIDPDIGLAVDVTDSYDTPRARKVDLVMGKGPAIKVMDDNLVADQRIVNWMADSAKQIGIPYQYEVLTSGGTDAGAINLTRAGVPSGCLSIPTRYIHSPSEMVDYEDVLNSVKLLAALISKPVELERYQ
jgi:tetrahedral aminopeptidase